MQNCGKYEWNEADPTIPSGWKSRVVEGKLKRNFFLCPDGSVFACRRSGLHHIINEGFPKEEVEIMRGMLVHEGWKFATFLPKGRKNFLRIDIVLTEATKTLLYILYYLESI